MDFQYYFCSFSTFLLLFFPLWLLKHYCQKPVVQKLPPGPRKLPIIGNLYNNAFALGHRSLLDASVKYGPLMHLKLGEISVLVVSSSLMAKEVMKINDLSFVERAAELVMSYGRKDKDISFSPYGDHWKQMRKVCTLELLSSKRVQSFSFIREHEVYKLIESIQNSCTSSGSGSSLINLSKKIFPMTSTITSRAIFGREFENQEKFIALTRKIVDISKGFDLSDLFPSMKFLKSISSTKAKLVKVRNEGNKILEIIINEHREKLMGSGNKVEGELVQENLVDALLKLQHSGSLETQFTTENIIALIWEMYGGGTDLSSIAVEWTMSELMRNPRVMEKAQAEIREAFKGKKRGKEIDLQKLRYLKSVIKESLRLHPPLPILIPRECRESCKIDGYDIPIKTKVIVNAWAIGRDPVYWDKAESFITERFDSIPFDFKVASFEYLPFGAGRRMCPGILYGLANIELPLAQLLYHFNLELPNGMEPEDLDMTETISATVGRKNNLHLIATSYN